MIESNIKEIIEGLDDFDKKQLPYATSYALNKVAEISMKAMKHKIDKDFDVTASWNKVGGEYGVRKRKATKNNLEVEIYIPTKNSWLEDHQDGDSRANQLIPTNYFKKMFPNLKTNRAIKKKASSLLSDKKKNRIFEAPLTTGFGSGRSLGSKHGPMAIYQRVKGTSNLKRVKERRKFNKKGNVILSKAGKVLLRNAMPLFIIKDSVKEKSILGFYETISSVYEKNLDKEFHKALSYAISNSK